MAPSLDVKKLAMIGCGSMGGGMALLFAEHGIEVGLQDPSTDAMDKIVKQASTDKVGSAVKRFDDYKSLCEWFGSETKVFTWSLPHGTVGDKVLEGLMPYLRKGDIMIDAANEHWENSERRMGICTTKGIRYVAMGVSGGYQAARRGPSMCPGSDDETLNVVLPLLEKVAAKDTNGKPCTGRAGTGGAGHYVKMLHNGIEHGMMSAIAEAWGLMTNGLGMSQDEIGDVFEAWNKEGEMQNTFLIWIGADICRTKDEKGERVLDTVEDKVVQDVTGEEGTGVWSNVEAVEQHVPAPTLTMAHYFRLASSDLRQRRDAQNAYGSSISPQKLDVQDRKAFLEQLRLATYAACLSSFIQGMLVIARADASKHFNIDYNQVLQIWSGGCIIQADYIVHKILAPLYKSKPASTQSLLTEPSVAAEMKKAFQPLKNVVLEAVKADHIVPSLSATLEWVKYSTGTDMPTSFYEAQLDYFGNHMFDMKGEDEKGLPTEGKYSYEWKAA